MGSAGARLFGVGDDMMEIAGTVYCFGKEAVEGAEGEGADLGKAQDAGGFGSRR